MNRFATPVVNWLVCTSLRTVVHVNLGEMDVTQNDIQLEMKGFIFAPAEKLLVSQGTLRARKQR